MSRVWICGAALCALHVGGCGDEATAIRVEVTSTELVAPRDVDELRFEARTLDGARMASGAYRITEDWPHTLVIRPADDADDDVVEIVVRGLLGGAEVAREMTMEQLVPGRIVDVTIRLLRAPMDGGLDAGDAATGMDAGPDAGPDAATGLDAGPDATTGTDAGPDAGMDAGADAGRDAGTDAGPIDAGCLGPAACPGSIVLSEVSTGRTLGSDEYVEIHNRTGAEIDLSGLRIQYASAVGTIFSTSATLPAGARIPAHGYYLVTGAGYTDMPAGDFMDTLGFATAGGHVRLLTAGMVELDRLGWGTAGMPEGGMAIGANPMEIYERKALPTSTTASMMAGGADAMAGNDLDTDVNLADWVPRTTRDPQNRSSPAEP